MQATSMMEAASGKGYYNNGGSLKKDKSSNPKKENSLSSSSSNEFKSTFSADEWNSLSLKQRDKDKGIGNIDNMHLLQSSFAANQETNIESTHCQSSEFEDGIDYAFLNETYSIHYSESKLKNENVTLLNSDFNPGILKREENFFGSLEHQDNKTISLERILKVSDADYKENGEDMQKYDIDEDSQQEYHSAEQEYISKHLSFDQAKALSLSDLDVVELTNPGYGVRCVSNLEESCHVEFGSGSTTSLNSLNAFTQEYSPHVSKFQNSVILKEYHEPDLGRYNEQETVFDDIVQRCSSLGSQDSQSKSGFLNTQKALKTKTYTRKVKSQVTESKDFCGNTAVDDRSLHHFGDPGTLPQDKSFETLQPHNNCQTYWNSVFDDSVISACGYSYYESLQSTPEPGLGFSAVLPRITINNQATEEDRSLHVAHPTNKMFSHDMKGTCPKSVTNTASSAITINQAVDVSTDFRACFTTSRATSAAFSVVSTSSNTEITMMSKKRPAQRHCDSHRSVACNTDRLRDHDCVATQTLPMEGSGKSLSPNGSFLNKDSQELKTSDVPDIKKHPEREFQLSKEIEKNLPSTCCQKIMQRAIKAEMHLLNVHYEMCHRHCCDIYKLVMENRPGLYRNLSSTSAKKELGSALLSVWGDLKVRYMNLKEKLQQGIQLEELPPLSVESKLLSTFSTFASRLMKEDSHDFLGVDSELDNQGTPDSDVSTGPKQAHSEMSLLPDNSHSKQDTSPKKDDLENDDINVDFSQLKLDDKECRNYHERTEDWFDATENLTGVNFSGIQENQIENDRENLKFPLEMKNVELLQRDKGFLIHVGGLCSSVSEADLRSHFQKYQVSEISIYDSSNYRYASLAFKKHMDAKMAVKEMNGIEINGKPVNVRLVKTPGEYMSPLAPKNGSRVSSNHVEKNISKEVSPTSSVSRCPKARLRQLGSEQDSEFSPLEQKGIKKNCKQIESAHLLPETPVQFIPPNTLNLRSFTKIMKRLTELHPEVSRDHIIDALQEVRMTHKGFLNGLSINTIVEMTSSVLKNSASA
ncbi:RNA-binding protein 44 [Dipodomys spectabilis]|uniref:RNA-binding protein 44 n=1 Tax=Dipodomys spectabilis TaxID=105255 RepID=UPI001C53A49B|nr:RNA-binding protein 44 [Dipodomys spectabilis]